MRKITAFLMATIGLFAVAFAQDPVVNMISYSDVDITEAKFTADFVSKGSWTTNGKGFVYSTNPVPTKENGTAKNVSGGSTLGQYNATVTNLAPSTTYYVRAYVKRGSGTSSDTVYSSNTLSFTTPAATPPTFSTPIVSAIGLTNATFSGSITDDGDASVQSNKGFVYSTNPNPTYFSTRAQVSGVSNTTPVTLTKSVEGLSSGVTYYVRTYSVIKYGSSYDTVYSNQVSFTTQHACGNPPFGVTIEDIGVNEAVIHFNGALGQVRWEVDYGFAGHNAGEGVLTEVTDTLLALSDLEGGRSYAVFVRAICGDMYSNWSDIRTFTTVAPPCADVSGVHARELGYSSAKIEWTPGSMSQTMWEVSFARASDPLPESGVIVYNDPMFSPIGLTPQSEYKLKVRALCGEFQSNWSDVFTFNTIQQGLEEAEVKSVRVYPNPSNGILTFEAPEIEIYDVEICDGAGKLLYKAAQLPKSFDFKGMKGIFFLHIDTEYGHQVEKIIVQ